MIGKVSWYNDSKGYGFLEADGHPLIFAHYTAIIGDGYKTLADDQPIEFDLIEGPKGPQAMNIRKLQPHEHPTAVRVHQLSMATQQNLFTTADAPLFKRN